MAFLLALLGLIVAGDVVELEPVRGISPGNNYKCNDWSQVANQSTCEASPYCRWYGGTTIKCYDDPCLKLLTAGQTCPGASGISVDISGSESINVPCKTISNLAAKWTGADCGDDQEVVDVCAQDSPSKNTNAYNYCVYAKLRDGTCPDSVCREYDVNRPDNSMSNHCIPNDNIGCEILSTSTECGLVPKCYWKSSKCIADPCYIKEEDITGVCANYHPPGDASATCTEFKPYKKNGAGSVVTYCVISANNKPNLCYLGTPNTDDNSLTADYTDTYPTLNISSTTGAKLSGPTCTTTGTSCDNMADCTLVVNKKGGLAGAYCTDGTHGASSILHIPSLFAVLVAVLFSIFHF